MIEGRRGRPPTLVLALLVPLVVVVTAVVTLSITSDDSGVAARPAASSGNSITIANFRYSPDPLVVRAGTRVEVTNRDGTAHTVTAQDRTFDTGDIDGGASATIALTRPGTYHYFCNIHNYMTGTIEVR